MVSTSVWFWFAEPLAARLEGGAVLVFGEFVAFKTPAAEPCCALLFVLWFIHNSAVTCAQG